MDELTEHLTNIDNDGFWDQIQSEARQEADREAVLASFLFAAVLVHKNLEDGLSVILANKLHTPELPAILLRDLINEAFVEDASVRASIRADLLAARTRDPAARGYAQPFLYYKGFHALQAYRVAHWLWEHERHRIGSAPPESHLGGVWSRRPSGGSDWLWSIDRPRYERRHRRDCDRRRQRIAAARSHTGRNGQRVG